MTLEIPANRNRFIIKLTINAFRPLTLGIKAFDPSTRYSHYLRRKVTFKEHQFNKGIATRELEIRLPISPKKLLLELKNKTNGNDEDFEVKNLKVEKMPPSEVWASSERHRFMDFAINFAQQCGNTPTGYYPSPNDQFLIQYLPAITDNYGKELVTPARISRAMPRVQLSQRLFQQFSIPVRVAILAHEGCHYFKNTRSEKEADLCGIKYYLDA